MSLPNKSADWFMNAVEKYTTVCTPGLHQSRFQRLPFDYYDDQWSLLVVALSGSQPCWVFITHEILDPFCFYCSIMLTLLHSRLVALASGILKDMQWLGRFQRSVLPEAGTILHCLSPSSGNCQTLHETFALMNPFGIFWHLDRAPFDESLWDAIRSVCAGTKTGDTPLHSAFSSKEVREFSVSGKKQHGGLDHLRWRSRDKRREEISSWIVDASRRKVRKVNSDSFIICVLTECLSSSVQKPILQGFHFTRPWWVSYRWHKLNDTNSISKREHWQRKEGFLSFLGTHTLHISQIIKGNDYQPHSDSIFSCCTATCTS